MRRSLIDEITAKPVKSVPRKKEVQEYLCPTHAVKLLYVLKGGAGFCRQCSQYIQAAGMPMPTLDRPRKAKEATEKMNQKRKGNRSEYKSIALLESLGYKCTRAAASLGVFDVIAIGEKDILLCQVKTNRWPGAQETDAIRGFRAPAGVKKVIHRWRDRQQQPDIREVQ